jgi:hypothetical protein
MKGIWWNNEGLRDPTKNIHSRNNAGEEARFHCFVGDREIQLFHTFD